MRKRFSAVLLAAALCMSGMAAAPAIAAPADTSIVKHTASKKVSISKPKITGKKRVGKKLKVKLKSPSGSKLKYQWLRNGSKISGATSKTYKLRSADKGKRMSVRVTATKPGFKKSVRVSKKTSKIKAKKKSTSSSVYYKNCTEARNAGVTPIYRGDPGYASHLDRDNDGVACE